MNKGLYPITQIFTGLAKSNLYKSSFFIILTSICSAGFGFLFWMLAARLYPKEDVGIAIALISSINLLLLLSQFGLGASIIRFFPERDKSKVFSTSIIIQTSFVVLLGIIFILGLELWSPNLKIIRNYIPLYLSFLIAISITSLAGSSFIALRKARYFFLQNLVTTSRLLFLIPFTFWGALGIFSSIGLASILTLVFSLFLLYKSNIKFAGIDRGFIRESFHFSTGNYIASILAAAPMMILPLMILNIIGPAGTALYYISFSMASLLFSIPGAFSTALFVEGSHGEGLRKNTLKSLSGIFILLLPAVVVLYFGGEFLLKLIGRDYLAGLSLLRVMILAGFFVAISQIYLSILNVQKNIKSLILLSALIFLLLLGQSYFFLNKFGLIGVGYAYLISYGIISLIIVIIARKNRWI